MKDNEQITIVLVEKYQLYTSDIYTTENSCESVIMSKVNKLIQERKTFYLNRFMNGRCVEQLYFEKGKSKFQ